MPDTYQDLEDLEEIRADLARSNAELDARFEAAQVKVEEDSTRAALINRYMSTGDPAIAAEYAEARMAEERELLAAAKEEKEENDG
jgi:hypothetical protein